MTIKNRYLLPQIDELFEQLRGETILSKIYLSFRYNQVHIKEEDIHTTDLWMRYKDYEFVVVPYGLTNAPATSCI